MAMQAVRAAAAGAAAAVWPGSSRRPQRAASLSGCICSSMTASRMLSQSPVQRRPAPPRRAAPPAAGRTAERSARRQQLFVQVEPDGSDTWRLDPVVEALKAGAVGIIPTDSNPAFVCDVGNRAAVEKLLEIKRARGNIKMSILCRSLQDVDTYTLGWPPSRSPGQPDMFKLVKRVLPGAYTFILPASKELPKAVTNLDKGKSKKRSEVGVRLPDDPVAQALLAQLDRPLLCSTVSPADGGSDDGASAYAPDAATLMDRYGNAGLDFVVDAGPRLAEGSTVIDCTGAEPEVVRRGKGDPSFLEG